MINFFFENLFKLEREGLYEDWLTQVARSEGKTVGEISYIFCDDAYLLKLNQEFLNHDTLTDVIGFPDSVGDELHGDIFISTERVMENAVTFGVSFEEELRRVMVHGLLHFCGYADKTSAEREQMQRMENAKMKLFHVEQQKD